MGGYYALLQRGGPSMFDIARASGLTRAQREDRDLQTKQLERQDRLDDLDLRKQESYEDKFRYDREQAIKAKEAESLANKQRYFAQLLEARPADSERIIQAARQQGVTIDRPVTLHLPGGETYTENQPTPQDIAANLQGAASGVLGAPKPEDVRQDKSSMFSQRLVDAGIPRGTPRHQQMMERFNLAELERMEREPRGGININLGGKPVPASSAEGMGDAEAAMAAVDDMFESFKENVPNDGWGDQVVAVGKSKLPNTDESIYDAESDAAVQTFGRFLEGGVLKEAEFGRYKKMAPKAGDSLKTAERKSRALKRRIQVLLEKRREQLGAAGYRVQQTGAGTAQPQMNLSAEDDAYFDANFTGGQ